MAIRLIVTRGFGNGTYSGSIKDVVLRGYSISASISRFFKSIGFGIRAIKDKRVGR